MTPKHIRPLQRFIKALHWHFARTLKRDGLLVLLMRDRRFASAERVRRTLRTLTGWPWRLGWPRGGRYRRLLVNVTDDRSVARLIHRSLVHRRYQPEIRSLPPRLRRLSGMRDFHRRYLVSLDRWINRGQERYCFPSSFDADEMFRCDETTTNPDNQTVLVVHADADVRYSTRVFDLDLAWLNIDGASAAEVALLSRLRDALERAFDQAIVAALGERDWPFLQSVPPESYAVGLPGQTYFRVWHQTLQRPCCVIDRA